MSTKDFDGLIIGRKDIILSYNSEHLDDISY